MSVFQVFWHVSLHVEGEVVRPRETPLTHFAFEGLGSGVLPVMSGQLVRPGEYDNIDEQGVNSCTFCKLCTTFIRDSV